MMFYKKPSYIESLPAHTKEWLKTQPIWHDRDMFYMFLVGLVIGLIVGGIL
jgi:hypothetical protein